MSQKDKEYKIVNIMTTDEFNYALNQIKNNFEYQKEVNAQLLSRLASLQEEKWKDEELQHLREERDTAREEHLLGFPMTQEQWDKIQEWQAQHIQNHHNGELFKTAIGGNWVYEFIPTSIGKFGSCICGACRRFVNNEYPNPDYDLQKQLKEKYDYEFTFMEP